MSVDIKKKLVTNIKHVMFGIFFLHYALVCGPSCSNLFDALKVIGIIHFFEKMGVKREYPPTQKEKEKRKTQTPKREK